MANQTANARNDQSTNALAIAQARPVHDVSGYTIFSSGDAGDAHVMAHRMLDENRIELGHQLLGEWLQKHSGSGSDWIHLHFHMAIFELVMGDWHGAYKRFMNEILPAATASEEALTDAPALLWRLALTFPGDIELPWEALRNTALNRMQRPSDPFVELHNLLALAGARDVASIDEWLKSTSEGPSGASRTVDAPRFPWATPASCSRPTACQSSTSSLFVTSPSSRSPSAVPSGSTITSTTSPPWS